MRRRYSPDQLSSFWVGGLGCRGPRGLTRFRERTSHAGHPFFMSAIGSDWQRSRAPAEIFSTDRCHRRARILSLRPAFGDLSCRVGRPDNRHARTTSACSMKPSLAVRQCARYTVHLDINGTYLPRPEIIADYPRWAWIWPTESCLRPTSERPLKER